jgi:hypothetical protein
MVLVDSQNTDHRLSIGKRGVLLSVLGTDVVASEVPATLDNHITTLLRGKKPFFEFEMGDEAKNQLCITYNEGSNTVFIIGITDVILEHSIPVEVAPANVKTFGIKLKKKPEEGLTSNDVLLARLESERGIGSKKYIRFYHVQTATS